LILDVIAIYLLLIHYLILYLREAYKRFFLQVVKVACFMLLSSDAKSSLANAAKEGPIVSQEIQEPNFS
jgi:hypothetical protein